MIDEDDIYYERLKRINNNYNNDDSDNYSNHLSHDFAGSNGSSFGPLNLLQREFFKILAQLYTFSSPRNETVWHSTVQKDGRNERNCYMPNLTRRLEASLIKRRPKQGRNLPQNFFLQFA